MAEVKTTAQKAASKTTAAKRAPAAKPAARTSTAKKAAAPKKAATPRKTGSKVQSPSNEERYKMIQVAAYYLAERDGFSGNPVEYWTAAEIQINDMLSKK